MKKALITRFGGVGDVSPLTVVGAQLKKRGYHVTLACRADGPHMRQSDMFRQSPAFDNVIDIRQGGPWGLRCIKTQLGWATLPNLYRDFDLVLDYMNIIENNSTSPYNSREVGDEWQRSRNSNYSEWTDQHLAWANINPDKVPADEKRPIYTLLPGEDAAFRGLKEKFSHLFVVQTTASSLSRTWYQGLHLPPKLLEEYPEACVVFWDARKNQWVAASKFGVTRLRTPNLSPLRVSMALVAAADVYVGADTGFTHVAEAFCVPHVAIYSTVPAWTRNKYYKYQTAIDMGEQHPEFYTFNLGLGDPLRVLEGQEAMSDREKQVDTLYRGGIPVEEAAAILNTDEEGAKVELQALEAKKHSWERQQSKALSLVTVEMVMEKVKGILDRSSK